MSEPPTNSGSLTGKKRKQPSAGPTPQQQLEQALRRQQERDAKKIRPADSLASVGAAPPSAAGNAVSASAKPTSSSPSPALSAKDQLKERLRLQRLQLQVQKRTQSAKPRAGGMAAVSVPVATLASVDIGEVFGAADDPEEHSRSAAANSTPSLFRPDLEPHDHHLHGHQQQSQPQQQTSAQALDPEPEPEPVPPCPEDPAERQLVEHLVAFINKQGPSFELVVKTKNQDNPQFAWLHDKTSVGYRYYQYRLGKPSSEWAMPRQQREQQQEQQRQQSPPRESIPPSSPPRPQHSSFADSPLTGSRTPPSAAAAATPHSPPEELPAEDDSQLQQRSSSDAAAPTAESSLEAMNAFIARLEQDQPERAAEGHWLQEQIRERSARLSEATAATQAAPGGSFNRLLARAHHPGGHHRGAAPEPAFLSEDRPQIGEDNPGYQMLRRMGWEQDTGLGRHNHGRVAPVKAAGANSQLGIGARAAGEIVIHPDDDEATKYKKRMALAYRQRPNPNNSRRTPYWQDDKMNKGASQF